MNQNRQPANTVGLKPTQKGGTFTAISRPEATIDLDAGAPDSYMASHGWPNNVRKATPDEECEYLLDGSQRVYTTDGGRKILLGRDWDGDSGAAMKAETLDDEIAASSANVGTATCARYVLRDAILKDALKDTVLDEENMGSFSLGYPDDSKTPEFSAEFFAAGGNYKLNHEYGAGGTSVTTYRGGRKVALEGEDLDKVVSEVAGRPVDGKGQETIELLVQEANMKMLADPDIDDELKAAIES